MNWKVNQCKLGTGSAYVPESVDLHDDRDSSALAQA